MMGVADKMETPGMFRRDVRCNPITVLSRPGAELIQKAEGMQKTVRIEARSESSAGSES
jgi:hypothetical protein